MDIMQRDVAAMMMPISMPLPVIINSTSMVAFKHN